MAQRVRTIIALQHGIQFQDEVDWDKIEQRMERYDRE